MSSQAHDGTFGNAFDHFRSYPSSGAREAHDGVPAGPTLAASVIQQMFDLDVSPINSETREVLAAVYLLADDQPEGSVAETVTGADSKADLREMAEEAVEARYPSAADFQVVGSPNYSCPAICAMADVSYDVDPVEATQDRLSGETKRLTDNDGE